MMDIELSDDRRRTVAGRLQSLFREEFDEDLSEFRADEIVDFFVKTLGPDIYNQAVADVRAHLQAKLDDLDGDVFIPEAR